VCGVVVWCVCGGACVVRGVVCGGSGVGGVGGAGVLKEYSMSCCPGWGVVGAEGVWGRYTGNSSNAADVGRQGMCAASGNGKE